MDDTKWRRKFLKTLQNFMKLYALKQFLTPIKNMKIIFENQNGRHKMADITQVIGVYVCILYHKVIVERTIYNFAKHYYTIQCVFTLLFENIQNLLITLGDIGVLNNSFC